MEKVTLSRQTIFHIYAIIYGFIAQQYYGNLDFESGQEVHSKSNVCKIKNKEERTWLGGLRMHKEGKVCCIGWKEKMWIIHSELSFRYLQEPMTHFSFQLQLTKDLFVEWIGRKYEYLTFSPYIASTHGRKSMRKKHGNCQISGKRTNHASLGCHIHICKGSCF